MLLLVGEDVMGAVQVLEAAPSDEPEGILRHSCGGCTTTTATCLEGCLLCVGAA